MIKLFKITSVCISIAIVFLLSLPTTTHALTLTSSSNNLGLNAGLVGWWTFDGKDVVNGRALDKSGNANHGTLTNISTSTFYTTGKIGQGFRFDGTNDYITLSNTSAADMTTNNFTVSLWLKTNTTATTQYRLISKRGSDGYEIYLGSGQNGLAAYCDTTGGGCLNDNNLGTASVRDMKWHHAVVVFDRSGNMTGYVDGNVGSSPSSISAAVGSMTVAQSLMIGQYSNGGGDYFNGSLDDVRVYNRALSATEIRQLYNQGAATKQGVAQKVTATSTCSTGLSCGLVGYWSFDGKDVVNGRALDKSGNANHGTLTNISTSTFYTTGKIGQGFKFDGVNDTVNIATNMFANRTEFSLMVWTKKTKGTTGSVFSSSNGGPYWRFTSATTILHYIEKSDCTGSSRGVAYPDDGKFHYIGFTVSTAGLVRFYVDGVVVDSYTYPSWNYACADATDWRSIGSYAVSNYFNGLLDDVRIYNRALSATEVTQLYNQGAATKQGVAQKVTATSTCSTGLSCGLVGYWSFDGKDVVNGVARDKSGGNNHGNLVNIATSTFYVPGKIGQGFKFDGVDDYVSVGNNTVLAPTTAVTISAWVKPLRKVDSSHYSAITSRGSVNYLFMIRHGGVVVFYLPGVQNWVTNDGAKDLFDGQWHHALVTYDGSFQRLYIDTTLISSSAITGNITSNSNTTLIGRDTTGASNFNFNGLLDDVRIYNRALSATEVRQLYNQGKK